MELPNSMNGKWQKKREELVQSLISGERLKQKKDRKNLRPGTK